MHLYKTQYSFRISGNRGYDSNRVRFFLNYTVKCLDKEDSDSQGHSKYISIERMS